MMLTPGYLVVINIVFLLLIYVFLWRVIKAIYIDIYERPVPYGEAKGVIEKQQRSANGHMTLEVIESDAVAEGRMYPLSDLVTIGRSTENEIVLRDPLVSHQHSRIIKKRDEYMIMDLDSTNGTIVGKSVISGAVPLKNGTKIKIGSTIFRFKE
jgi:hypothetical protein